jgi:hypothetical protein
VDGSLVIGPSAILRATTLVVSGLISLSSGATVTSGRLQIVPGLTLLLFLRQTRTSLQRPLS